MGKTVSIMVWGYDSVNKVWRPILVDASGNVKVKAA